MTLASDQACPEIVPRNPWSVSASNKWQPSANVSYDLHPQSLHVVLARGSIALFCDVVFQSVIGVECAEVDHAQLRYSRKDAHLWLPLQQSQDQCRFPKKPCARIVLHPVGGIGPEMQKKLCGIKRKLGAIQSSQSNQSNQEGRNLRLYVSYFTASSEVARRDLVTLAIGLLWIMSPRRGVVVPCPCLVPILSLAN